MMMFKKEREKKSMLARNHKGWKVNFIYLAICHDNIDNSFLNKIHF